METLTTEQIELQKMIIREAKETIAKAKEELKTKKRINKQKRELIIKVQNEVIESSLMVLFNGGYLNEALS